MRIICMFCSGYYEDKGNSSNGAALYVVCPQCDKRVKKANKKHLSRKKERDKRNKKW